MIELKEIEIGSATSEMNPLIKVPLGLYIIYWKGGGSSLASIGMNRDGSNWIAPINWTAPSTDYTGWSSIEKLELIAGRVSDFKDDDIAIGDIYLARYAGMIYAYEECREYFDLLGVPAYIEEIERRMAFFRSIIDTIERKLKNDDSTVS